MIARFYTVSKVVHTGNVSLGDTSTRGQWGQGQPVLPTEIFFSLNSNDVKYTIYIPEKLKLSLGMPLPFQTENYGSKNRLWKNRR